MVSSQNIWEDLFMKVFGLEYMTLPCQSPMADLRKQNEQDYPWKVNFFVGDGSWGCGGNMRPVYSTDLYRRYQTYVRHYSQDRTYKNAWGPNIDDYH